MTPRRYYVLKRPLLRFIIRGMDAVLDCFVTSQPRSIEWPSVRKVLVIRLDHIGDVVLSIPVYRTLKRLHPTLHVTALVSPEGEAVLRDEAAIDELWTCSVPWFTRPPQRSNPFNCLALLRRIRRANFDIAIDLRGDLRQILLLWFAGVPTRLGYGITGGGALLTHELPFTPQQHVVHRNLSFLASWSVAPSFTEQALSLNESAKERAWIAQMGMFPRPWVVIHSDAGTATKRWPDSHVEGFLTQAQAVLRGTFFLIGLRQQPGDLSRCLTSSLNLRDLRGNTALRQMMVLLVHSNLLISTDSGPLHLAAALGTPCLALWSGTNDPAVWFPLTSGVHRLQHDVLCQFCELRVCPIQGHPCMTGILPEQVLQKAQALLEQMGEYRH